MFSIDYRAEHIQSKYEIGSNKNYNTFPSSNAAIGACECMLMTLKYRNNSKRNAVML